MEREGGRGRFIGIFQPRFYVKTAHEIRVATAAFWKWALFPFSLVATGLIVSLYLDNLFVPSVWYLKVYFYFFFVTQVWMITQFFLYLNYRKIRYDLGDRFSDPVPDKDVTVIISSFNEPYVILEKTVSAVRQFFTGKIMVADDSTGDVEELFELTKKQRAAFLHRSERIGYKAGTLNNALKYVRTPYVILLDSDAVPSAEFFSISKSYIQHYDFVQFPQYYENRRVSYVSGGAYAQQVPFMFRIMPLRSQRGSAFMLGTNVIFRKDSITKVGGFDEKSITEDLSTSLLMHEAGYKSVYVNRKVVMNSAPETLRAYFTQQERWAKGTLGVFRQISSTGMRKMGFKTYFDYFVGSSWYLYGFAFLFMSMSVFFFALFHAEFLMVPYITYVSLFIPYIILTLLIYYTTILETGHGAKEVFLNMSFNAICFPIYIKALLLSLFRKKILFNRTPKKLEKSTEFRKYSRIAPQLTLLTMLITSVMVCLTDFVRGYYPIESLFNAVWGSFYISLLIPIYLYPY